MKLLTFSDVDQWRKASLEKVLAKIEKILINQDSCRIALSGGSTPQWLYTQLSDADLDFKRIEIFQVDERYTNSNSPNLNANMIKTTLAKDSRRFKAVHFFNIDLSWHESAQAYDQLLNTLSQPLFDLVILGVGPDGHTASLFPHSKALASNSLATISTTDSFAESQRLTLTSKAITQAASIIVLASGKEKQPIIDRFVADQGSIKDLPILSVRRHPDIIVFYNQN